MSAFVSNCHFTVYFGEISPKPRHRRWRAKEDPLSFDSMRSPASVLLIAGAGDEGPFHGAEFRRFPFFHEQKTDPFDNGEGEYFQCEHNSCPGVLLDYQKFIRLLTERVV